MNNRRSLARGRRVLYAHLTLPQYGVMAGEGVGGRGRREAQSAPAVIGLRMKPGVLKQLI